MNIMMNGPALTLDRAERLALTDAAGAVAAVKSGCLWITMENDLRDIVLTPGDTWTIERDGRTIISAEEKSTLVLTEPIPRRAGLLDHVGRTLLTAIEWMRRPASRAFVPYY